MKLCIQENRKTQFKRKLKKDKQYDTIINEYIFFN